VALGLETGFAASGLAWATTAAATGRALAGKSMAPPQEGQATLYPASESGKVPPAAQCGHVVEIGMVESRESYFLRTPSRIGMMGEFIGGIARVPVTVTVSPALNFLADSR
jgi:hypothetical protein